MEKVILRWQSRFIKEASQEGKDEVVGWPHPINGHELEQTPGDGEGQRSLACCSPWGRKELHMTEQLNSNRKANPVFCPSLGSK